ncbi:MAG: DeoR/GlpR family DNA-binding transcription regulator [Pseudomonadota bacterium]
MNFRHEQILERARQQGKVTVEGLARHFGVTLQTIRRDLTELADAGQLKRVHGGAILPSGTTNIEYEDRRRLNDAAKMRVGLRCAAEIKNGSSVFLGIGTTCEAVARALVHHEGLMVMTNNLNAVPVLASNTRNTVIVTGGRLRAADAGLVGPQTASATRAFKFDLSIIGCSAIDEDGDLFDYDLDEVIVSQAVIENSRAAALVADVSKFRRQAPARIASLDAMSLFCTDAPPPLSTPRSQVANTRIIVAADPRRNP